MAVRHSCFLYSYGLPGSSVLLMDYLEACDAILSSGTTSPRNEALFMIGSLLYLPQLPHTLPSTAFSSIPSSSPGAPGQKLSLAEFRERVIKIIYRAAERERGRIGRCIALYQVGIVIFSELWTNTSSGNLQRGLDILLLSLKVKHIIWKYN